MTIWAVTLAFSYLLCALANQYGWKKPQKGFAAAACILLILVSGLRQEIGDTETYKYSFTLLPGNFSEYFAQLDFSWDWGFDFLCMLIKTQIADDGKVMIFLMALITILCVFIGLYRYSDSLELAVFLFITAGSYLTSMNAVRQYLASAVLFLAMPLLYKRKWYLYFPLVLLMAQIHSSAYLFLLLYFVVSRPGWGKVTYGILAVGAVLFLTYGTTGSWIASLLADSQYGTYSQELAATGAGANLMRSVVMAVPVVLSFQGRDLLRERMPYFDILTNFSVLNLVFILLANRYWIYARMNLYFTLYMILLLCGCIQHLFEPASRKILYVLCLAGYGFYYWYEMYISLGFREGYIHFIQL